MSDSITKLIITGDPSGGIAAQVKMSAALKKMESDASSAFNTIKSHWAGVASALAIPVSIAGFGALIKSTTEAAENMELLMQKTGASYETLKVLSYTAKLSGTDIEGVSKAMGILAKNMQGAAIDIGGAEKSFKALGIDTKDSTGHLKSIDAMLPELADRFQKMNDGTGKTAYAMALFGKSGKDMIPILNQGSQGLKDMKTEMEGLGFTFDEVALKKAAALNENIERLEMAFGNLKTRVVMEVVPGLLSLSDEFIKNIKDGGNLETTITSLGYVLKGLASTAIGVGAAFDLAGTSIGEGFAKFTENGIKGMADKLLKAPYNLSMAIDRLIFGDDGTAPAKEDKFSQIQKKIESYANMIQAIWNKDYTGKSPTKKPGLDDPPLLGGKAGSAYADALRMITEQTTQWQQKIAEMNPALEKQDSEILRLTNDAENLVKRIEEAGKKGKVDVSGQVASIRSGLEQGKGFIAEKTAKEEAEKQLKIQQKAAEDYKQLASEEADFAVTENERAINAIIHQEQDKLSKLYKAWLEGGVPSEEEYEKTRLNIQNNALNARIEKETEAAKKIADINYSLIQGISGMETWAHELRMAQIEAEAEAKLKDRADPRAVAAWKNDQTSLENIKTAIKGDDWTAGYKAQLELYKRDMKTAGEYGAEVFAAQAGAIKDTFSELFSDLRKGELKSWEDYFSSFADKMLSKWEDILSTMLTNWIMTGEAMKSSTSSSSSWGGLSSIFSWFSGLFGSSGTGYTGSLAYDAGYYHSGGIVGDGAAPSSSVSASLFASAPRYHLGTDEYPAILQRDEGVFTPGQMAALGPAGNTINVPITINSGESPSPASVAKLRRLVEGWAREEMRNAI